MLPEIGATELMVIAAVALIVVGPKDLPLLLRKLGQFVARLRGMANDFRSSFDEMARQSELEDLRKEVAAMRSGQFTPSINDGQVSEVFDEIDAELRSSPTYDPFSAADYPSPDAPPEKPKRVRKPKAAPPVEGQPKSAAPKAVAKAKPKPKPKPEAAAAGKPATKVASARKTTAKPKAKA